MESRIEARVVEMLRVKAQSPEQRRNERRVALQEAADQRKLARQVERKRFAKEHPPKPDDERKRQLSFARINRERAERAAAIWAAAGILARPATRADGRWVQMPPSKPGRRGLMVWREADGTICRFD